MAQPPVVPPPTPITLPAVEGRNLRIVSDELTALGLTSVTFGSVDEDDTVVLLASNWTAVSIEPGPGSTVRPDQTIVVMATKR